MKGQHLFFRLLSNVSICWVISLTAPFLEAQPPLPISVSPPPPLPVSPPPPLPVSPPLPLPVPPPAEAPKALPAPPSSTSSAQTNASLDASLLESVPLRAQEILSFWFGPLSSPLDYPTNRSAVWYSGTPMVNRRIRTLFKDDMRRAVLGEYNNWRGTPRGRLALILLLDQFPRNIYPGLPRSLASDAMARGLILEGLQKGDHLQLYPAEQVFFYLPLKHAESSQLQDLSVNLYTQLLQSSPPALKPQMQAYLDDAILQREIIARFGRFPDRNDILGRKSTPEEIIYLRRQVLRNISFNTLELRENPAV